MISSETIIYILKKKYLAHFFINVIKQFNLIQYFFLFDY